MGDQGVGELRWGAKGVCCGHCGVCDAEERKESGIEWKGAKGGPAVFKGAPRAGGKGLDLM
jgi:hypothetical protein